MFFFGGGRGGRLGGGGGLVVKKLLRAKTNDIYYMLRCVWHSAESKTRKVVVPNKLTSLLRTYRSIDFLRRDARGGGRDGLMDPQRQR